jgi:hypothetical protein
MSVLDDLKAANRHTRTLPGDLDVTMRYPSIQDCIVAGSIPLPLLAELDGAKGEGDTSPEALKAAQAFNDELVRSAVVEIRGEAVDLRAEVLSDIFTDEQRAAIVAFATRQEDGQGNG